MLKGEKKLKARKRGDRGEKLKIKVRESNTRKRVFGAYGCWTFFLKKKRREMEKNVEEIGNMCLYDLVSVLIFE